FRSFDSLGRETTRSVSNGPTTYLTASQAWDSNNNLISSIDPRLYETDFAYDANGNTIAEALPSVTTSDGTFRPTSLYSYDSSNNVTAFCDPKFTHQLGRDWTAPPAQSDTLCLAQFGRTLLSWST